MLSAVDARAQKCGLVPGMPLADARAMQPGLVALEADAAADAALLDRIAGWCARFSPVVVIDPPDGLALEVGGSAHLFGGEAALMRDVRTRLAHKGLAAQCALAPTPAAAWALARWKAGAIVAADILGALAPLPLAALRLEPESEAFLRRIGLRTIGQIAAAPRAAFAARAGERALLRLDQALGRAREALTPRRPAPKIFAARRLMDPIFHADALLEVATTLIADALAQLDRHNAGVRDAELTFFGVDGADLVVPVRMSRPERAPRAMLRLVREKLQTLPSWEDDDLGGAFGFEAARLDVFAWARLDANAPTLHGAEADGAERLSALVDVLSARLGPERVTRPVLCDAHAPEAAEAWESALAEPPSPRLRRGTSPVRCATGEETHRALSSPASGGSTPQSGGMGETSRRPLTLFAHPQPVEALALAPDGPPVRFVWRRLARAVKRAEGPERIAGDWLAGAGARDYYRVEDDEGRRYWMYRAGAYGAEAPPRWFVHGLFA